MGLTEEDAHCAVRLSIGVPTTQAEIDHALDAFRQLAEGAGEIIEFATCR
jgi:cysteine sulfinate desulfinase/cysteine desulfurase-like protein